MNQMSAVEQMAALRAGRITSATLVDDAIAHIERLDPAINAVVVKDFERARMAAEIADKARKAGNAAALLGLPMTVKEAFDVEGLPTTWGVPGEHPPASADAVVIARLRAAGAIILGKTNVPTMLSDWQTANAVFGTTNNPWDTRRTPGGSSGGGAAAVASGMTALEFGSDLNGSLRIPATFCGVFSHRPSYGVVPMRGFAPPMAPLTAIAQPFDQSTIGPIARTAADLALAFGIAAGPDRCDANGWHLRLRPARQKYLKNFRVLLLDQHPLVPTSDAIRSSMDALAKHLSDQDVCVSRNMGDIPDPVDLNRTFTTLLMSRMGAEMPEDAYAAAQESAKGKDGHDQHATMSHRDWIILDRHRLALAEEWAQTFMKWDVVLCPATPTTAFLHDDRPFEKRTIDIDGVEVSYDKLQAWTSLATPAGLPVTTVPIGHDPNGMPFGMQIIGGRFGDHTTLEFANLIENQLGYAYMPPPDVRPK